MPRICLERAITSMLSPFTGSEDILIDLTLKPQEEILSEYSSTARSASGIVGEAYMPALRDGKIYLYGTASVLRDSIGNIVGAVESIRDITERKQAEEIGRLEQLSKDRWVCFVPVERISASTIELVACIRM